MRLVIRDPLAVDRADVLGPGRLDPASALATDESPRYERLALPGRRGSQHKVESVFLSCFARRIVGKSTHGGGSLAEPQRRACVRHR